ncbi:uncharacterized protein STEHIDRAFT_156039 [Stereum hirsutum FP-91666 SS1]|uniref:uncharacterized protein n=1 Tax=Stereum hirsutum (strain FP-91666) TaxID=721885 RepID=UPI000440DE69|nr:uncharacterized protein STEHIDRAFT_156039 [Stereum hirsutum FP-91666 SS1]EIM87044.1 hypothetical protein STEHIDRAFT_156039 [Stereum hirsutum FP-91666 SS1]
MPIFAFTAGSLDDIITVITLATQIAKVLAESTDSTNEHRFLAAELTTFTDTLRIVRRELESPTLSNSARRALMQSVLSCKEILSEMEQKTMSVRGFSGQEPSVRWVLFNKEEVEEYKRRLSSQWACMNTILEASNRCCAIRQTTSSIENTAIGIAQSTSSMHATILDIAQSIAVFQNLFLRHIHNVADPVDLQSSLFFVDLLGEKNVVPMNFCESEELCISKP